MPAAILLLILFQLLVPTPIINAAEPGCADANVVSGKLITDVCWDCIFPIKIAGMTLYQSNGTIPGDAASGIFCNCPDRFGVPRPGVIMSMWEPARIIELQRIPGCSSVLGGHRIIPSDRLFIGHHGTADFDGSDGSFMHYHYYAFPLIKMLELIKPGKCNADGYADLDLMYFSEIDPTWNNSELAFFTNPEAAVVANPLAALSCSADAISATLSHSRDSMFWCAGTWGSLYPLSGHKNGGGGVIKDSSLLAVRAIAALHRRGLAWKTMGNHSLCGGHICPTLPKTQYKFSVLHPVPETKKGHGIGAPTCTWGATRTIPGFASDPIYIIWRWHDCCNF